MYKIDAQMQEEVYPKLVLWDNPEGSGAEGGGRGFRMGGIQVYL